MSSTISRRSLLGGTAIAAAGLLAGCTVAHGGSTTTATLDISRIVTDGRAILTALSAVLAMPLVASALGANEAAALAAVATAQTMLTTIEGMTGGTVTVTIDSTRLQTLVTSLLADVQTALLLVQKILPALSGAIATEVSNLTMAALALVPVVQLAAGLAGAAPGPAAMSEADALAVLRR